MFTLPPINCHYTLKLSAYLNFYIKGDNTYQIYFIIIIIIILILFWLHWVFVAAHSLSLIAASRGYSSLQCVGFLLQWLLFWWSMGSRHLGFSKCGAWPQQLRHMGSKVCGLSSCGSRALEHRFSSCGTQAQLLRGICCLPRPGLEPVSPTLAGGFLTTAPPGKPDLLS